MDPFAGPLPVVVGHRGAPRCQSENTPASFAAAARAGATWVELDARRTADGVVVVHHDAHLADGTAVVALSAAALAARGVAGLAAVLDGLAPGLGVDVEVKHLPGEPDDDEELAIVGLVAALLHPRRGTRPLMTSSFDPLAVAALAAALPDVPAGQLAPPTLPVGAGLDLAREVGARVLCPHTATEDLDARAIAAAHAAGLAVLVWTVDDPDRARELAAAGADALCTNESAAILAAVRPPR